MYVLYNSVKNLVRNKGRYIIMAIIILTIITAIAISFIINTTTDAIIKDYKSRFSSEVTITFDLDKLKKETDQQFIYPSNQDKIAFGDSDLLSKSECFGEISVDLKNLMVLSDNTSNEYGYALIYGSSLIDIDDDFKNGNREIEQGRMYKDIDECLISKELAQLNGLSVGDTIDVDSIFEDNLTHQLTISGIYEDYTSYTEEILSNRSNEIIVDIRTAVNMKMFDQNGYLLATYFLKNPSLLEDFHEELLKKGLPEYYKLTTDEAGYKKVVGPVEGLTKIFHSFRAMVLVLGVIILIFLFTLNIRERKYEIGVLRAMGMKKRKVITGFLLEILIITTVCLIVGLCMGAVLAQPVTDTLLKSQIKIVDENEEQDQNTQNIAGVDESIVEHYASPLSPTSLERTPLSELCVSLTDETIIGIILTALLLASISSLMGIFYIIKYKPIRILSERN